MGRSDQDNGTSWFNRRDILRAAGATTMIGAASGYNVQPASAQGSRASNDAPLGLRLQGVQHFGFTGSGWTVPSSSTRRCSAEPR